VPDLLDQTHAEIEARRAKLASSVDEYHQLEAALEAMDASGPATVPGPQRRPGRPPARKPSTRRSTRRIANVHGSSVSGAGARRGSRAEQMLIEINASPGLTVLEYARRLKINPTYAHEVAKRLVAAGAATATDHRLYPGG
jgi:hypothetical protein